MRAVTICGDGVRTQAVRTTCGIRVDVLDPDPRVPDGEARLLASFDFPLHAVLALTSGRRCRAEQAGQSLEIAVDGPLVEVRYAPGDGTQDSCETLRRDYLDALMRLCGASR